jgi:predicted DCC family thiol-disulfide oxidoreductase YuxK
MMAAEPPAPEIEVFFDGGCPLCSREVRFLRRWDRRGVIRFTDIDAEGFEPAPGHPGLDALMARIHAQLPDGRWIEGVEVFRRLYTAIGFGPLVALSRLTGVRHLLDWSYALFARNRRRLFGRCSPGTCGPARAAKAEAP